MGGDSVTRDSMSESTLSKNSGDGLIAKSPQKKSKFEFKLRTNKDVGVEEQKDSFKWIPNPADSILSETKGQSTLESISSTTTSDFSSTGYGRNGYIRGSQPLVKYNEFNSLVTSLGACPVEVKVQELANKNGNSATPSCREDELSILLITGGIQMMLGILMAVFGVLIIVHNASLAGAGSGLWGGAVAMLSGVLGVLAGLKGCYSSKRSAKVSPALLTAFLAMCLVSFALTNLVLVLTATGLIRDINQQRGGDQDDEINWPPVLSNAGLIVAAVLQCIIAVVSGYKCYKKVCPCARGHSRLQETDSQLGTYKVEGKDRLVNTWLGQQYPVFKKNGDVLPGQASWGSPKIVLLPPPPRMATGPMPLWTFLHPSAPPSITPSGSPMYPCCPSVHKCCCHRELPQPQTIHTHRPAALREYREGGRRINYIQPDPKIPLETRKKRKESRRERRVSAPSAEDIARSYTGRDREIAEEFIAIAMEKGRRRSRANSVGAYSVNGF